MGLHYCVQRERHIERERKRERERQRERDSKERHAMLHPSTNKNTLLTLQYQTPTHCTSRHVVHPNGFFIFFLAFIVLEYIGDIVVAGIMLHVAPHYTHCQQDDDRQHRQRHAKDYAKGYRSFPFLLLIIAQVTNV